MEQRRKEGRKKELPTIPSFPSLQPSGLLTVVYEFVVLLKRPTTAAVITSAAFCFPLKSKPPTRGRRRRRYRGGRGEFSGPPPQLVWVGMKMFLVPILTREGPICNHA